MMTRFHTSQNPTWVLFPSCGIRNVYALHYSSIQNIQLSPGKNRMTGLNGDSLLLSSHCWYTFFLAFPLICHSTDGSRWAAPACVMIC